MFTKLWAVRLDRPLTQWEADAMIHHMPSARREHLLKLQAEQQALPLCAYMTLRLALKETYRWTELPAMATTASGKPYFQDCPKVCFSLSHTDGAVLVGLSDQPVGVDIEQVHPVKQKVMAKLPGVTTEAGFFRRWVRLEARGKRSGNGLNAMLDGEPPLDFGEFYYELETFPGYAAGVSVCDSTPPGRVRLRLLEELITGYET